MKKIIFLLLAVLPCYAVMAQSDDAGKTLNLAKDEQAIWNNVLALHNAVFGNKDSIAIERLVSNIVEYGHSTGLLEDKPAMVKNAVNSTTRYEQVSNQLLSIKTMGKIGILRMIIKGNSTDKGVTAPLHLGVLQVWQKEGKDWKIIERQAVKLPVK